jgi:hypothetical protein
MSFPFPLKSLVRESTGTHSNLLHAIILIKHLPNRLAMSRTQFNPKGSGQLTPMAIIFYLLTVASGSPMNIPCPGIATLFQ